MLALSEPDPNSRARASGGFAHPHTRLNPAWRSRDLRLCWWKMSLAEESLLPGQFREWFTSVAGSRGRISSNCLKRLDRDIPCCWSRPPAPARPSRDFCPASWSCRSPGARRDERRHRFTPSIFRLSRRLPPTSPAISKRPCARWDCPFASRREPAIRHPTNAPARSRSHPTSC